MKILIVSTNTLPASPSGAAYLAGSALQAGHQVEVYECLFTENLAEEITEVLTRFTPDVIGISIRLVHGYLIDPKEEYNTRHVDLRQRVREVVNCIRRKSNAPIVLGGPGFHYYGSAWLEYLDLDYGLRGEADISFPLYLKILENGGDITSVPGCIFRRGKQVIEVPKRLVENLDETAFPAYELFDLSRYDRQNIYPAILTKRGCGFRCTYCPYPALEGNIYRLKSPKRVVDEIESIQRIKNPKRFIFCDNNFNVPHSHARAICQELIDRKVSIRWGSGDIRPMGITPDFCELLIDSGCDYVNLSIESASDTMLSRMQRGYHAAQVQQSLDVLTQSGIPFSASLMIGAPGETPATIAESFSLIERYPIPLGIWVTIGICLWTPLQPVLKDAYESHQIHDNDQLFNGINYMSPEIPQEFMIELIATLKNKEGYTVQVNKPYADYS